MNLQYNAQFAASAQVSRDRLVVRTLRCGRNNPGSNPGHGNFFLLFPSPLLNTIIHTAFFFKGKHDLCLSFCFVPFKLDVIFYKDRHGTIVPQPLPNRLFTLLYQAANFGHSKNIIPKSSLLQYIHALHLNWYVISR